MEFIFIIKLSPCRKFQNMAPHRVTYNMLDSHRVFIRDAVIKALHIFSSPVFYLYTVESIHLFFLIDD
jgi:hypothetical protein